MLKIPSLVAKPSMFADKFEEEAFWQLHKKQGGGYINRRQITALASELRLSAPTLTVPPLIVPKIALPSIAPLSLRVPKL